MTEVPVPSTVRLTIGDTAVARIAAQRAARVPGVYGLRPDLGQMLLGVAGSALGPSVLGQDHSRRPTDGVHAVVREHTADVSIALVTTLGHNCRDLAVAVQLEVAAEVAAQTGLEVTVGVRIVDILMD